MFGSGGTWQVRLRGGWTDVGPEDCAFIESAHASHQVTVSYRARGKTYEVDFQRGVQRDSNGRERPIRRTGGTSAAASGGGAAAGVDEGPMANALSDELAAVAAVVSEVEEGVRVEVRGEMVRLVLARLGLMTGDMRRMDEASLSRATPDGGVRDDLARVRLFRDTRDEVSSATSRKKMFQDEKALLQRFEVLASPCIMDYGEDWKPLPPTDQNMRFWVHHAAALNVGESGHAADFTAYSNVAGELDEAAYLRDMRRVFTNLFEAQIRSKVQHSVLVPIGMGAFLRHLARNDPKYAVPECIANLRCSIARELALSAKSAGQMTFHVCVQGGHDTGEASTNNIALKAAFTEAGISDTGYVIREGRDATAVALELAKTWWQANGDSAGPCAIAPVSLANAANARLLGNHWFAGGAQRAIDENLHRRASLLGAISLLLNGGTTAKSRHADELASHVVQYGGDLVVLETPLSDMGGVVSM